MGLFLNLPFGEVGGVHAQIAVTALPKTVAGGYNISCNNGTDGEVTTVVTGNTGPYTLLWSNSSTASSITSLSAGTFWVTVTDSLNNTATDTVTLIQPSVLGVSIDAHTFAGGTHISEHGAADGEMYSDVTGGIPPYQYDWNTGSHAEWSYKDRPAGAYTLIVTDAGGCQADADQTLTEPTVFTVDVQLTELQGGTHITCAGESNGSASATPSGGIPPYTYDWATEDEDSLATDLSAGFQKVKVYDANGVKREVEFTLIAPDTITTTITTSALFPNGYHTSCHDCANAIVTASATGGISPYEYQWLHTDYTTATITNAGEPYYDLIVRDANGCKAMDKARLSLPERDDWSVNGNSGLNADSTLKWLGTSDSTDLVIKTNGQERVRVSATGSLIADSTRLGHIITHRITTAAGDSLLHLGDSSIIIQHASNRIYGSSNQYTDVNGMLYGVAGTAIGPGSLAKATGSVAIGANARVGIYATGSITIGHGQSGGPLINNTPNTMYVGFNGSQPTLVVTPAAQQSATGNIGVAVTQPTAKLDVGGPLRVRESDIYLRGGTDANHGLGWYGAGRPFASTEIDGPALYGYNGGALGSVQNNTQNIALRWNSAGNVGLNTTDPQEKLHINGNTIVTGWLSITSPGQAELFPPDNANSTQYKLSVNGNVVAEEFTAKLDVDWYDHVFAPGYRRPTPDEKAVYYDRYRHLMGVPSESELRKNGIPMTVVLGGLTRNVEENSLDIIELFDLVKELKAENKALKAELLLLQNR